VRSCVYTTRSQQQSNKRSQLRSFNYWPSANPTAKPANTPRPIRYYDSFRIPASASRIQLVLLQLQRCNAMHCLCLFFYFSPSLDTRRLYSVIYFAFGNFLVKQNTNINKELLLYWMNPSSLYLLTSTLRSPNLADVVPIRLWIFITMYGMTDEQSFSLFNQMSSIGLNFLIVYVTISTISASQIKGNMKVQCSFYDNVQLLIS